MAIIRDIPRLRDQAAKLVSQSWKWLTGRLSDLPQVRLVLGEKSPQLTGTRENFEDL
jgi:hypothetical protein